MKLLIIRHGDPDYAIDGLTEVGKIEAELLGDRLAGIDITKIYCSPLGRARKTAEPTLLHKGMEAECCEWLREFDYAKIQPPYLAEPDCAWDILPEYMDPIMYHPTEWVNAPFLKGTGVAEAYKEVCAEFDKMLAKHGYQREGCYYRVTRENHDTVALFCHYGLTCVLLSHLLGCSPYSMWQHVVTPPTAVTTFHTEERRQGIAHFRAISIGDTAHLYKADREPSFAARFCECFRDPTRHD